MADRLPTGAYLDERDVSDVALVPRAHVGPRAPRVTVLGLGNPLMGDDGLGVAVLERLRDAWIVPPSVTLLDGGTWGMHLLPDIEGADRLLLIDAIARGMPPGTEVVLDRAEIPRWLGHKISPHQIDLREVLALAELRGTFPEEAVAIGLQPERIESYVPLSPRVEAKLDAVVRLVVDQLGAWGVACVAREHGRRASNGTLPGIRELGQ